MRSPLWLRLWLAFGVVLVVAVSVGAWVANVSTERAFRNFVTRGAILQQERLIILLGRYYATRGSWAGIDQVLSNWESLEATRLTLFDARGNIVGGESTAPPGGDSPAGDRVTRPIMTPGGRLAGYITLPAPTDRPAFTERRTVEFLATLARSLIGGALAGGLVALALSLFVARRIVRPIERLREAVRRLGAGDYQHRLQPAGVSEVAELTEAFNSLGDQLARDQHLRRQLVADIAHELRSPLANIRGHLEALRDGVLEAHPDILANVHDEAVALQRLVEDLQELSLVETGRLTLDRRSICVEALIERAVVAAGAGALAKGIDVEWSVASGLPEVWVDPDRTGQILRNLLANAITHTPPGGRVKVTGRLDPAGVAIEVQDTGPGIAPDEMAFIFERFYRADTSRDRATGGAGLGLTIARQLAELHGGSLVGANATGHGAVLTLCLPAAPSSAAAPPGPTVPLATGR